MFKQDKKKLSYSEGMAKFKKRVLITIVIMILVPFVCYGIYAKITNQHEPFIQISSLFIAVWTLEASIVIALLIYHLQKLDEIKSHEEQLKAMRSVLRIIVKTTIDYLITTPFHRDPSTVSSNKSRFEEYYSFIGELVDDEESRSWLDQLIQKADIDSKSKQRTVYPDLFREWLQPVVKSKNYSAWIEKSQNKYLLLNQKTYLLLNAFNVSGALQPFDNELKEIKDTNGKSLFKSVDKPEVVKITDILSLTEYKNDHNLTSKPSDNNQYINVYYDGNLVFSGKFNSYDSLFNNPLTINDGYEKSKEYEGYYSEGKPNGLGKRFAEFPNVISEEGLFENNHLVEGIQYCFHNRKWKEGFFAEGYRGQWSLKKGKIYDYRGKVLDQGTFDVNSYEYHVIDGISNNWILLHHTFLDKEKTDSYETIVQYFDENGFNNKINLQIIRMDLSYQGFDLYYVADLKISKGEANPQFENVRPLKEFMNSVDPSYCSEIVNAIKENIEKRDKEVLENIKIKLIDKVTVISSRPDQVLEDFLENVVYAASKNKDKEAIKTTEKIKEIIHSLPLTETYVDFQYIEDTNSGFLYTRTFEDEDQYYCLF